METLYKWKNNNYIKLKILWQKKKIAIMFSKCVCCRGIRKRLYVEKGSVFENMSVTLSNGSCCVMYLLVYNFQIFQLFIAQILSSLELFSYPFPSYDNSEADDFEHILSKHRKSP